MNVQVQAYLSGIKYHLNVPLFKNSFNMFITRALIVAVGFFFWMIAARLYSMEEVGLAVALISSASAINIFSLLGFDISIIRFLSLYHVGKIVNTTISVIAVASLGIGIAYCLAMTFWSPDLAFIRDPTLLSVFVGLVIVSSVSLIAGNIFIAMRRTDYYLLQNIIISSRTLLLVPLVFLGSFGIVSSTLAAYAAAVVFVLFVLGKSVRLDFSIDREFIARSLKYSSGNYAANLLFEVPFYILPVMVLQVLGQADVARYYIALTIGGFLMQISSAISTSLFVEGSNGEGLRNNVIKSGIVIYSLMVPAFILLYLFGDIVLGLYGEDYAESLELLKLVAASSFFHAIYLLFCTVKRVRMGVRSIISLNLLMFILLLSLSYVLMGQFGLAGVGYAVLITYVILDLAVLGYAKMEGWI